VATDPRGLTRQGRDRKADLLRQAEALFMERGYAGTRMADIARASGVTKSLVYWYFETKEALFQDIAVDMRRRLRREQSAAMGSADDPLERLYLATVASVRFLAEHSRLYGMILSLGRDDPHLRATHAESRRVLADDATALLAEGQDRGVVRSGDDPAVLAQANAGAISNLVLLYVEARARDDIADLDLDDVAHAAARYAVHAVAADSARAAAVVGAFA
jgi:AcrR family transcriptional regulator